jgi:hypothetical protein
MMGVKLAKGTQSSAYSSKHVGRLMLGLFLISAALVDFLEGGNLIGESLPAVRPTPISFVLDLLLIGSGVSLFFSRNWRVSRWPIIASLAPTLLGAIDSISHVESRTMLPELTWIWIVICVVTIGSLAWATSGE